MANTSPRDAEERRLGGGSITPRVRDREEQCTRPELSIPTTAQQARDPEEARLAAGIGR